MTTRSEIEAAAARLAPHIRHTPVIEIAGDSLSLDFPVKLKLELLQHTGSFKPRGAFNRLLSATIPEIGVITASGGNHGAAVAYAARVSSGIDFDFNLDLPAQKEEAVAAP